MVVLTGIATWGELQAFAALFNTHHAQTVVARSSVAYSLWITGWMTMILPLLPLSVAAAERTGNELYRVAGLLILLVVPPLGLAFISPYVM
jgi:hypothetical protein